MDKYERRRLNLLALIRSKQYETPANFSRAIDRSPSYVARMTYPEGKKGRKRIADDMLEHMEQKCSLPRGWFDEDHEIKTDEGIASGINREVVSSAMQEPKKSYQSEWIFDLWDEQKIRNLSPEDLERFQNAAISAASVYGLDVICKKSEPPSRRKA